MSECNSERSSPEGHILSSRKEYDELQRQYDEIKAKYISLMEEHEKQSKSSFIHRLSLVVSSLFDRPLYSDIVINCGNKAISAHKLVLHARSSEWNEDKLGNIKELDWTNLSEDVAYDLLRWIYTDEIELCDNEKSLALLKAAHQFKLIPLLKLCENSLVTAVSLSSCVQYYCAAEEVGATTLKDFCSNFISSHWDELVSEDFLHMSARSLLQMLRNKTSQPLHEAVRLLREDVVHLFIKENPEKISDITNSLSKSGCFPLQIALTSRNLAIAEALIRDGLANKDAYDFKGNTILLSAIKNCDLFSANYLVEQECDLNLTSRNSNDSVLHLIASFNPNDTKPDLFSEIIKLGEKILARIPNVNLQNNLGETPLHLAINVENMKLVTMLLNIPKIDIDLPTIHETTPLESCLKNKNLELAKKLLQMGANPNPLKSQTGNSLLQTLISEHMEDAAIFLIDYANKDHVNNSGLTALHIAVKSHMPHVVKKLLESGASPNLQFKESNLNTALHLAVEAKAVNIIEEFVQFRQNNAEQELENKQEIPDFNLRNSDENSPLNCSIELNYKELVPLLIRGGANINECNRQNFSLLHKAILRNDSEMAILLLQLGINANALTDEQKSPIELAVLNNLPQVVDELCKNGAMLISEGLGANSLLWTALEMKYEEVAKVLVKHGVDVDCWSLGPDGYEQTLLHRAIEINEEQIANFLIQSQCNIDSPRRCVSIKGKDSQFKDGATPLHLCCQRGLTTVLRTLIDHGANVNALDSENKTPLHIAIENKFDDIISILLYHPNINLGVHDKSGNTPFAAALSFHNHKAAQRVLDRFPNAAEQMDHQGRNFLHLAIMKDDLESVLFLLGMQVDVNSRIHSANHSSPLHLAAKSRNEMIIRNLILAGARINECDGAQRTPLHIAAESGNLPAVSALIQNGANFDAVDADKNNALHIAARCGHIAIVRELLTESNINAEALNLKGRNPLHELCQTGEDTNAAAICELFVECMPKYPLNVPDIDGNTPLLLAFMRGQAPLCKFLVKSGACLGWENCDGISIFNFKLATDQLLYKLLDHLPRESPWSESDVCQECGLKFSLTIRKHHCRHCGRTLCFKCSSNSIPILKFGINKPVRVCSICFSVLQGDEKSIAL